MTQDIDITDDEPVDTPAMVREQCGSLGLPDPDLHRRVLGTGWQFDWSTGDGYRLTFSDTMLLRDSSHDGSMVKRQLERLKREMRQNGDL